MTVEAVEITCDQSGCTGRCRIRVSTVAEALEIAGRLGWANEDGRDACPEHESEPTP